MKKIRLYLSATLLLLSSASCANEATGSATAISAMDIHNCGRWIIQLNAGDQASKTSLIQALDIIGGAPNLHISRVIRGPMLVVEHQPGVYPPDQDQSALRNSLEELARTPGVTLECDTPVPPTPRLGGST